MGSDLDEMTLAELSARIERRELSSLVATRRMLDRIEDLDRRLHAYVTVTREAALAEAALADREIASGRYRGPLHGVPVAVKDLCDTAGVRTTVGTRVMAERVPTRDATVVARLRNAGAVILGKLAMTEGAYSDHHPDRAVPVNPWSADFWSGVSSSGSGVATAASLCFASLGSDTGGSIRLPSAVNAIVGIKPTYGRVPVTGIFPMAASLDHVGPMCRRVLDAAIVLGVIAGADAEDPRSVPEPVHDYAAAARDATSGLRGLRIGFDPSACADLEEDLMAFVEGAVKVLAELGADVRRVELPSFDELIGCWSMVCGAEMLVAHEEFYPARVDDYGPALRLFLDMSSAISPRELARAEIARVDFRGRLQRVFQECDVIACPTLGVRAPAGITASDLESLARLLPIIRFTTPFDLSGSPALSIPCGRARDGFPASLQLVGRHFEEATLIRVAAAYEAATPWHLERPPLAI